MANELQEALLHAIDTVITNRVGQLAVDKTVTATVDKCVDNLAGRYALKYQGGMIYGYAQKGAVYIEGQLVYLLIPENDMTKKKIIIGLADVVEPEQRAAVKELIDSYNKISVNALESGDLYQLDADLPLDKIPLTQVNENMFNNALAKADALYIGGVFDTSSLKRPYGKGIYGLEVVLKDNLDNTKTYRLTSDGMNGEPNKYSKVHQYSIYSIASNRTYTLQSARFFCEEYGNRNIGDNPYSEDDPQDFEIFGEKFELYALNYVDDSASSGDYTLNYETPNGIFFENDKTELPVKAIVKNLGITLNNQVKYFWFQKNSSVTTDDPNYHPEGGEGWELVYDQGNTAIIQRRQNSPYENIYKVVCVIQDSVRLSSEFILYNNDRSYNIRVKSESGEELSSNDSTLRLVCNCESTIDQDPMPTFVYEWVVEDSDGTSVVLGDKTESNELEYPSNRINEFAVFTCNVCDSNNQYIGSASIKITKRSTPDSSDGYWIDIENYEQVFQYSAGGVSPAHICWENPQEIKPLKCTLKIGLDDVTDDYSVTWTKPENSLISDVDVNEEDPKKCTFKIKDNFDDSLVDNQMVVTVIYNNITLSQKTNFTFTKVGLPGTNGTEFVVKVDQENNVAILYKNGSNVETKDIQLDTGKKYNTVSIDYGGNTYTHTFPVISGSIEEVTILDETLKYVIYDADGKNPQYNNNGIVLSVPKNNDIFGNLTFTASGVKFVLDTEQKPVYNKVPDGDVNIYKIKVIPPDTFTGETSEYYVTITNGTQTIIVPFWLSINRYGIDALNGWDGQRIEIDNEGNYILAPQIGAGTKNNDNQFTGIVMGELLSQKEVNGEVQYDSKTGLFGFHNGAQSIFLDASSGDAIFGTIKQGQVIIDPDGVNTIGGWKIGQTSLYSESAETITGSSHGVKLNAEEDDSSIIIKGSPITDSNGEIEIDSNDSSIKYGDSLEVELNPQNPSVFTIYQYSPRIEIPNASFNNGSLTINNVEYSVLKDNTWDFKEKYGEYYIACLNGVYIQVKPSSGSPLAGDKILENAYYTKTKKMGINAEGNFYVNAVEENNTGVYVGNVSAFGSNSYVGLKVQAKDEQDILKTFFKIFIEDTNGALMNNGAVHLSGSNDTNEYARPIKITSEQLSIHTDADNKFVFTNDTLTKHGNFYLTIFKTTDTSGTKIIEVEDPKDGRDIYIKFKGTDFVGTNFTGTDFNGTNFTGTKLILENETDSVAVTKDWFDQAQSAIDTVNTLKTAIDDLEDDSDLTAVITALRTIL